MAEPSSNHETALAAIRQASLKHPDGPLLESFINDAVDRDRAAAFLLKRLSHDNSTNTTESNIGAFLCDWKRTITICNIPKPNAFHCLRCQADGRKSCVTSSANRLTRALLPALSGEMARSAASRAFRLHSGILWLSCPFSQESSPPTSKPM
jgi:hypothetical protein